MTNATTNAPTVTAAELVALRLASEEAETLYKARRGERHAAKSAEMARRAWITAKAKYAAGSFAYFNAEPEHV